MTSSSKDTLFLCFRFLSLPNDAPGSLQDFTRHLCLDVLTLSWLTGVFDSGEYFPTLVRFLSPICKRVSPGDKLQSSVPLWSCGSVFSSQRIINLLSVFATARRCVKIVKSLRVKVKVSCMFAISLVHMASFRHSEMKEDKDGSVKRCSRERRRRWGDAGKEDRGGARLGEERPVLHNWGGTHPFWSRTQSRVMVCCSSSPLISWRKDINSRWSLSL